jgi:hypothetical protein
MSFTHRAMLRGAALALSGLLIATAAQAGDQRKAQTKDQTKDQDRTVGFGGQSEERALPSGPVGHRQPRASDFPSGVQRDPSDEWLNRLNRETDSKLQICRGC